jgi:hypothetical protein
LPRPISAARPNTPWAACLRRHLLLVSPTGGTLGSSPSSGPHRAGTRPRRTLASRRVPRAGLRPARRDGRPLAYLTAATSPP